jgi:hypothetical protein
MSPGGISFDMVTQGGEQGFDWHVSSAAATGSRSSWTGHLGPD